jgi:hypothetical protein
MMLMMLAMAELQQRKARHGSQKINVDDGRAQQGRI